jgi:hypothetical protein
MIEFFRTHSVRPSTISEMERANRLLAGKTESLVCQL